MLLIYKKLKRHRPLEAPHRETFFTACVLSGALLGKDYFLRFGNVGRNSILGSDQRKVAGNGSRQGRSGRSRCPTRVPAFLQGVRERYRALVGPHCRARLANKDPLSGLVGICQQHFHQVASPNGGVTVCYRIIKLCFNHRGTRCDRAGGRGDRANRKGSSGASFFLLPTTDQREAATEKAPEE